MKVVIVTSALCIVRWTKAKGESSRISKLIKVETKKRVSRRFLRQTEVGPTRKDAPSRPR